MDEARFERSAYTKAQLENYPRYKTRKPRGNGA